MASAMPDLGLLSQPYGVTALWSIPFMLLGDRDTWTTCLRLLPERCMAGSRNLQPSCSESNAQNHYTTRLQVLAGTSENFIQLLKPRCGRCKTTMIDSMYKHIRTQCNDWTTTGRHAGTVALGLFNISLKRAYGTLDRWRVGVGA